MNQGFATTWWTMNGISFHSVTPLGRTSAVHSLKQGKIYPCYPQPRQVLMWQDFLANLTRCWTITGCYWRTIGHFNFSRLSDGSAVGGRRMLVWYFAWYYFVCSDVVVVLMLLLLHCFFAYPLSVPFCLEQRCRSLRTSLGSNRSWRGWYLSFGRISLSFVAASS